MRGSGMFEMDDLNEVDDGNNVDIGNNVYELCESVDAIINLRNGAKSPNNGGNSCMLFMGYLGMNHCSERFAHLNELRYGTPTRLNIPTSTDTSDSLMLIEETVNIGEIECLEVVYDDDIKTVSQLSEPVICGKVGIRDFEFLGELGRGGYATVYLGRKIMNRDKSYAIKVLDKCEVLRRETTQQLHAELNILTSIKHPFIVKLHYAFQDVGRVYLVLDHMEQGELFELLAHEGILCEDDACFYTCEIALALGHLHKLGILYRDLKPENVLLGADGHIKLTDFGLSKQAIFGHQVRTHTFCGTVEYMAPEMVMKEGHTRAIDWWSLGALLYDMLVGEPPFTSPDLRTLISNIVQSPIVFPAYISVLAKDIVRHLLRRNPTTRLGAGSTDVAEIMAHSWFAEVNWALVERKAYPPPHRISIKDGAKRVAPKGVVPHGPRSKSTTIKSPDWGSPDSTDDPPTKTESSVSIPVIITPTQENDPFYGFSYTASFADSDLPHPQ